MDELTQAFSDNIKTRPLSVYEGGTKDPKDFLIKKSQRLKEYLDDYIDVLRNEKQREREQRILEEKKDDLKQIIKNTFDEHMKKLDKDIQ